MYFDPIFDLVLVVILVHCFPLIIFSIMWHCICGFLLDTPHIPLSYSCALSSQYIIIVLYYMSKGLMAEFICVVVFVDHRSAEDCCLTRWPPFSEYGAAC